MRTLNRFPQLTRLKLLLVFSVCRLLAYSQCRIARNMIVEGYDSSEERRVDGLEVQW